MEQELADCSGSAVEDGDSESLHAQSQRGRVDRLAGSAAGNSSWLPGLVAVVRFERLAM